MLRLYGQMLMDKELRATGGNRGSGATRLRRSTVWAMATPLRGLAAGRRPWDAYGKNPGGSQRRLVVHRIIVERRESRLDKMLKIVQAVAALLLPLGLYGGLYLLISWLTGLQLPAELAQVLVALGTQLGEAAQDVGDAVEALAPEAENIDPV